MGGDDASARRAFRSGFVARQRSLDIYVLLFGQGNVNVAEAVSRKKTGNDAADMLERALRAPRPSLLYATFLVCSSQRHVPKHL